MSNIIELKNVSFSYEKNKKIIDNVNIDIKSGEITTIIGKNGCGKTTLLHLIANNKKNFSGDILIKGNKIKSYSRKDLAKLISVVYQKNTIPQELTVEEVVAYGRLAHQKNIFSKKTLEDKEKIKNALLVTDLFDMKEERVENLSGGQMQRVFIAMAVAQDTDILLLDEPTSYLDIKYQKEVMQLVKKLNEEHKKTVVMVLHDINQALKYSHNIIAMQKGKILRYDKKEKIYDKELLSNMYEMDIKILGDNKTILTW